METYSQFAFQLYYFKNSLIAVFSGDIAVTEPQGLRWEETLKMLLTEGPSFSRWWPHREGSGSDKVLFCNVCLDWKNGEESWLSDSPTPPLPVYSRAQSSKIYEWDPRDVFGLFIIYFQLSNIFECLKGDYYSATLNVRRFISVKLLLFREFLAHDCWNYCQRTFKRNSQLDKSLSFERGINFSLQSSQKFENVLFRGIFFFLTKWKCCIFCTLFFFFFGNKIFPLGII